MNQKSHITIWLLFVIFLAAVFFITYNFVAYLGEEAHKEVKRREQSSTTSYIQ